MTEFKNSFNKKIEDLYSQLNDINSNNNNKLNNNIKNKTPNKHRHNYSSTLSDEKLLMYDLIQKKPDQNNFNNNNNLMNINSIIKNEIKNLSKSKSIFDIPTNNSSLNTLYKRKKLKSDNYNFIKKYSEIEDFTEFFKTGKKPLQRNKSNDIKIAFKATLVNILKVDENLSKVEKLKHDIFGMLRNDQYKFSRNFNLVNKVDNKKNLTLYS